MYKVIVFDLNKTIYNKKRKIIRYYTYELLKFCQQKLTVILWSSAAQHTVYKILDDIGIVNMFHDIITRNDICEFDPQRIKYHETIKPAWYISKKYNVHEHNIIFVDDSSSKLRFNLHSCNCVVPKLQSRQKDNVFLILLHEIMNYYNYGKKLKYYNNISKQITTQNKTYSKQNERKQTTN